MSLVRIFGLRKVAQKGGAVVLFDASVADALSLILEVFSASAATDSPKIFPTAAELDRIVAPSRVSLLPPHLSAEHHQPVWPLHCRGQTLRTRLRIRAHCSSVDELLFGLVCPGIGYPLALVTGFRTHARCPSLDELLFGLVYPGISFPLALVTRLRIRARCPPLDELLFGLVCLGIGFPLALVG